MKNIPSQMKNRCLAGVFLFGFLSIVLMLSASTVRASAMGSITVTEKHGSQEERLSGVEISLYKAAAFANGDYGRWILEADLAEQEEMINSLLESKQHGSAAKVVDAQIQQAGRAPLSVQTTGADGTVVFRQLEEGIYLLKCSAYAGGEILLEQEPVLLSVPMVDQTGNVIYDINCEPKNTVIVPGEKKKLSVLKVWEDENNRSGSRPKEILVGLYENEKLIEKVKLSDQNQWSYEWEGLHWDAVYRIEELDIPEGYRAYITNTESAYTITNVLKRSSVQSGQPQHTNSVKTGDDTRIAIWFLGSAAAVFALAGFWIRKRRNMA